MGTSPSARNTLHKAGHKCRIVWCQFFVRNGCLVGPGALAGLQRKYTSQIGAQWAATGQPLGQFVYSTYTEKDYEVSAKTSTLCPLILDTYLDVVDMLFRLESHPMTRV